MKTKNEEIHALTDQIMGWSVQMALLAAKQEAALETAKQLARELEALRAIHRAAVQQLKERELEGASFNMWENIGDGG